MSSINGSSSNMHFYIGLLKTLVGNNAEAVESFVNAIEKSDDNYYNHYYWKGVALAASGNYEQALGEFETARNIDKSSFKANLHIGICFLILGDLDNAYEAFKTVVGDSQNEMEVNYSIGKFFMMRGFMNHAVQSFQFALKNFAKEKVLQELVKCYISEKNLVSAVETYVSLEKLSNKNKKAYAFDITVLDQLKKCSEGTPSEAIKVLNQLEESHKEGFIFKRFDLLVYIALAQFLSQDYQNALKTFMLIEMEFYNKEDPCLPPTLEEDAFMVLFVSPSEREGQPFVSTKSITLPEIIYNMSICLLMLKHYDKAYLKLSNLKRIVHIRGKVQKLLNKLKPLVSPETVEKEKEVVTRVKTSAFDNIETSEVDEEEELIIFPMENRLCWIYPTSLVELGSPEVKIEIRLSFCLPTIDISDIRINVDFEEFTKINLRSIEFKPEAPWIKKSKEAIIFTNCIREDEVAEYESPEELLKKMKGSIPINSTVRVYVEQAYKHNLEAEMKKKQKEHESSEQIMNEGEPNSEEIPRDSSEAHEADVKVDLKKLKEQLKLDDRTNNILNKLK